MPSTPTPDQSAPAQRVRLTISVAPEVHATFQRMAEAGSMSISRAMGDWLADTVDAAEFVADAMERARAAPKLVAREMHAYALGLADETGEVLQRIRGGAIGKAAALKQAQRSAAPQTHSPPSSNTGGKVPRGNPRKGGGEAGS